MWKQAIQIIMNANRASKTITRQRSVFRALLEKMGNPQNSYKTIHITGTNGKGSVAMKTAYILQKAGYKTGLYTSPHLFSFLERIKINRNNIDREAFSQSIIKIDEIAKKHSLQLTFFEYLTACGFQHFKDKKCDFASIEVGLGGREDTTNVITPQLSIITSIGIDHEKILGSTRQQIAKDKAGIIKQNRPAVIGPYAKLPAIYQQARLRSAPLFQIEPVEGRDFDEQNNAIVRKSIQILRTQGLKISQSNIQQGLLIRQPCRMEQLPIRLRPSWSSKRVFFDVCHNPAAIQKMLQYYQKNIEKQKKKLIVLYGTSKQKNSQSALKRIQQVADLIFFIQAKHPRAKDAYQIAEYVGFSKYPHKFRVVSDGDIKDTMGIALAQKQRDHVIVCGSFFIMAESCGVFDSKYMQDIESNMQQQYMMKNKSQTGQKGKV